MNVYWIILIQIPVDTPPGHLMLLDKHDPRIEECGDIHTRTIHTMFILSDTPKVSIKKHHQQSLTIDYNKLKPYFCWVNAETIKETVENPT